MACFHPLTAYQCIKKNDNNSNDVKFKKPNQPYKELKLPCGQCYGCRLDRSKAWALRCVHEASLYVNNCFLTLTFNEQNINENHELIKSDFQNFMKRLRDKYSGIQAVVEFDEIKQKTVTKYPIRYFHCGEYGSDLMRPHHHACIFNFDFIDKKLWAIKEGVKLYRSKSLEELWPFGFCTIGDVTFQSAAYVARYCQKKITGKWAETHYVRIDYETGEILKEIQPEYITMSRRPGIARNWYNKYKNSDAYNKDFVTLNGKKMKLPKYYDKIYDTEYPEQMKKIKKIRVDKAKASIDNTYERLKVREMVLRAKTKPLKRSYENEAADVCNP